MGIAAFRDVRCPLTLIEIFTKGIFCLNLVSQMISLAARPERVSVGVVDQRARTDHFCVEEYCRLMRDRLPVHSSNDQCPYRWSLWFLSS